MLVIIGYVIVALSVFGGFALAGGHLHSLWQPVEVLMIAGAFLANKRFIFKQSVGWHNN